jgi:hypothetical protein
MRSLAFRGLRLPRLGAMRSGGGFSPASLFADSNGIWYDRSDIDTLFQDAAGTTPVTTAGQLDALKLDKSQGLVLGPEFADVSSFIMTNATSTQNIIEVVPTEGFYQISFATSGATASRRYRLQALSPNNSTDFVTTDGTKSYILYANAGTIIRFSEAFLSSDSGSIAFTAITAKLLPGNHATQSTTGLTSRYQVSPFGSEYDGNDDFSATPFNPTLAGTIAVRMRSDTASRVAFGSQSASNGRCYIGLASDGSLAGGIGEQATSVIKGSTDIRDAWTTGILTWDGTTVTLYQDGVSVYSAAQVGAVNTTIAMREGALNNNGTAAAFHKGRIAQSIVLDRVMTAAEIASITNLWSTIS